MEKNSRTDPVRKEELLVCRDKGKEEHTPNKTRKAN
jgi:hypothetical protein